MSHIGRRHKPEEHLRMTIDLSMMPLEVIQALKAHLVKCQSFEQAAHVREIEKMILKSNELINGTQ